MLQLRWKCILLFQFVVHVKSEGYYSIVAPGTIRPNSNYRVSVGTHNVQETCVIKIGIKSPSFNNEKEIQIPPNSENTVDFEIPLKLDKGEYKLIAKGISGLQFENETNLRFESKHKSIFIQTDKAKYKPGDLVRFRIIILDHNTRPMNWEEPVSVIIIDSVGNRIKELENIKLIKGVYSGEFQLSKYPLLGNWTIKIVSGDQYKTKIFEIAKHVLPKFETIVIVPKNTLITNKFAAAIKSEYTFGKPVKGDAIVTIKDVTNDLRMNKTLATKSIALDNGKAFVVFETRELNLREDYEPRLLIVASVKEKLTGHVVIASKETQLHYKKYKIEQINSHYKYVPNKPFNITVAVRNIDGTPVHDTRNFVKFILPEKQIIEQKLDEHGLATIKFIIPENMTSEDYFLNVNYLDVESKLTIEKQENEKEIFWNELYLKIVNNKPKLNENIIVKVMSINPIKYFIYEVVGRGNILKSGRIDLPDGVKEYDLKIKTTFEMMPRSNVYVYFIKNNEIIQKTVEFVTENQLQNFIKIDIPKYGKPGGLVDISVNTHTDSYVGILGVDQSVLINKGGNDLSKDAVFNELGSYRTTTSEYNELRPGNSVGLIMLSNANFITIQMYSIQKFGGGGKNYYLSNDYTTEPVTRVSVRKEFPEIWIFDSFNNTINGQFTVRKKVPETITSWVLTGFSVNHISGLGLIEQPKRFQVFQPFFISTILPHSLKRGEVISIPVVVFNYLEKNLEVEVALDKSQKEFELIEQSNDNDNNIKYIKRISINASSSKYLTFSLRPKKLGYITLKITATTPLAGDAVEQILLVEPEGVTQFKNKAVLIDLRKQNEYKQDIEIEVPENIVPDSVYAEISVVGDLSGTTVKNIHNLLRKPVGCGEQSMINFVPNILVLKYLESLNKLNPDIEETAKKYLEMGYQNELTFKHYDGSYSFFGVSDKRGSTWLTAYVARSFRQAAKYITIDEKVIKQALQFLADVQANNGSFPELGEISENIMVEDGKAIFMTAFTLTAFLENKKVFPEYDDTIKKSLNYLQNNVDNNTNLYSFAITAYVFQLANHEQKGSMLEILKSRVTVHDQFKYWSDRPIPILNESDWYWYDESTEVIDTTLYALMALLEADTSEEEVTPILKWLTSKRNSLGGYYSSQTTVLGQQAFYMFTKKYGPNKIDVEFNFTDDKDTKGKIRINNGNALLMQTHVLSPHARRVKFVTIGKGSIIAQVSYRYNVINGTESPRFKLKAKIKETNTSEILKMDVCTSFIPVGEEKETNMVVMEVSLPTGYKAIEDNLKELESVNRVKKIETKNEKSVIVVYFNSLDTNEVCSPIEGLQTHKVENLKPSPIIIYDYYNNKREARIFYLPSNSSSW